MIQKTALKNIFCRAFVEDVPEDLKSILFLTLLIMPQSLCPQMIKILTSDGHIIEVDKKLMLQSETLKNLFQDIEPIEDAVPLPIVSSNSLNKIITCLQNPASCVIVLQSLSQQEIITFVKDVTYLDISWLLDTALNILAQRAMQPQEVYSLMSQLPPEIIIRVYTQHPAKQVMMNQVIKHLEDVRQTLHHNDVERVIMPADERYLISSSFNEGSVAIWDLNNLKAPVQIMNNPGVTDIISSPDGRYLIAASQIDIKSFIKIWNLDTLQQEPVHILGPFRRTDSMTMSPDGKFLIAAEYGTGGFRTRIWDFKNIQQEPVLVIAEKFSMISVSSDSRYLVATGPLQRAIRIWDLTNLQPTPAITIPASNVKSIVMSPDNRFLIAATDNDAIIIWDFTRLALNQTPLITLSLPSNSMMVSSDSRYLIVNAQDDRIVIWDLAHIQKDPIKTLKAPSSDFRTIIISHDNRYLIAASVSKRIVFWDFTTMQQTPIKIFKTNNIENLTVSPKNHYLIASSEAQSTIALWGLLIGSLENPTPEQAILLIAIYQNHLQGTVLDLTKNEPLKKIYMSFSDSSKRILADLVRIN